MKNVLLNRQIGLILDTHAPSIFGIHLKIASLDDLTYMFTPLMLDEVRISQNFERNICDDITVSFQISYKEYAELYEHQSSLIASLTFEYRDEAGRPVPQYTDIFRKYRAVLIDPVDIMKQIPDALNRDVLDTRIKIRLIENTVYDLRLKKLNTIFTGTTVEDALKHVTKAFGINKIHMVPPDNIQKLEHLIIPPVKGFDECYNFIHEKYGVYMQGIIAYITDDTLFVYPPFDTTPKSDRTMTVYQADIGDFTGVTSMYMLSDIALSIVTNKVGKILDLATLGSENKGTNHTFMRGSAMINGVVEPSVGKNDIQFKNDIILSMSLKNTKMINPDSQNTVYHNTPTDNPFVLASRLSETQATLLDFEWIRAIPFCVDPGMQVVYYSDVGGEMSIRYGILEAIQYAFQRTDRSAYGENFVGVANVTLRLSPMANITGTNNVKTKEDNPIITTKNILKNF